MDNKILEGLNKDQVEAVLDIHGPNFIIAGPGSGKTTVVTRRAAYMIQQGINPSSIILFTFTNKAAKEIKDRISTYIPNDADKMMMGTYHSVCCKLLRRYAKYLGYDKNFSIYDTDDAKDVLRSLVDEYTELDEVIQSISYYKRKFMTPSMAKAEALNDNDAASYAEYYAQYQDKLKQSNAMDFDDLIFNTVLLLSNYPEVKADVNNRYKYIIADESHDSSELDLQLINLLGGKDRNICMILDDDQSIYSFRGSNIKAVLYSRDVFQAKEHILSQNYRCSKNIVKASRDLIKNNTNKIQKEIFTNNPDGLKPVCFTTENQLQEAIIIANTINALRKQKVDYKDIAILARTNTYFKYIEEVFLKCKIPYVLFNGTNLASTIEAKTIISYLKFLNNNKDMTALQYIINTPNRNIGKKSQEVILKLFYEFIDTDDIINNVYSYVYSNKDDTNVNVSNAVKNKFKPFIEFVIEAKDKMLILEPLKMVDYIIEKTNLVDYLTKISKDDKEETRRISNLGILKNVAESFDDIQEFIYNVSLADIDESKEDADNKVTLMTIHSSKGLEFDSVIIAGCYEDCLPHYRSVGQLDSVEEERRLAYVAATRAKHNLFFTRPNSVIINGCSKKTNISRFINEMQDSIVIR